MSSLARKRLMNRMDNGPRKRARNAGMVVYRGSKPEMKAGDVTIAHTAATASNQDLSTFAQGTNTNQRIGNKIKAWRIQGTFNSSAAFKVQILLPNDATAAPSNTVNQLYDFSKDTELAVFYFNPNGTSAASNALYYMDYKLPLGVVMHYNGTTSADCNRNKIIARITCDTAATIAGEIRTYFTDP